MPLAQNAFKHVSFTSLSGLRTQGKLIPLNMSKIILEFELVPNPVDAIRSSGSDANNAAKAWTIRDVQAK
eukprot:10393863-Prorocentrum_lima.AAC.1